jgi:hypothetical protein
MWPVLWQGWLCKAARQVSFSVRRRKCEAEPTALRAQIGGSLHLLVVLRRSWFCKPRAGAQFDAVMRHDATKHQRKRDK